MKQKVFPGATVVKGVATTASSDDLEAAEAEFESEDAARMYPVNPLFDKWCDASKVTTFDQLKELLLVEEFKNCISEKIVVYLNEQSFLSC